MSWRRETRIGIGLTLTILMLVAGPAAKALASAQLRFVNARGGDGAVGLRVAAGGQSTSAASAEPYGQAGELVSVPSVDAKLSLSGGASPTLKHTLADGASYTVVALPKGSKGTALEVLRNGKAIAGQAKLRIMHAAPELGSPDVRLGKGTIAQGVKFRAATSYLSVEPGSYQLGVAKPGAGKVLFQMPVSLAAGTATTVVVAGSGGSPEKLIQVSDSTVTPAGAPHTGFGGLAHRGERKLLAALLAALGAGALGGGAQLGRRRRSRT